MMAASRPFNPMLVVAACLATSPALAIEPSPTGSPLNGIIQSISANGTQAEVAFFVEEVCPQLVAAGFGGTPAAGGTDDLRNRCSEIRIASDPNVGATDIAGSQEALQAMGAEEDSAIAATEVEVGNGHRSNVSARVGSVRGAALAGADAVPSGVAAGSLGNGWGFFVTGLYGTGDKDTTDLETGFDMDSYGLTAGVDKLVTQNFVLGASLGYTDVDSDLARNSGTVDTDGFTVQLYGTYFASNYYIDGIAGYTLHDHEQRRNLIYSVPGLFGGTTSVDQVASSDTDSDTLFLSLAAGRTFQLEKWMLGPYARFDYARTDIDGFTESMSAPTAIGGGLAVSLDSQDYTSTTLAFGIQASTEFRAGSGVVLYPQLVAEYVHEFDNDNDDITGRFVDDVTRTQFRLPTDKPDRNYGHVGAGLVGDFGGGMSGHVAYQGLLGYRDLSLHAFEVGLRIDF